MTCRAIKLLGSKRNDAYEALREDTQLLARGPDELGEDEQPATADVVGLRRFLEDDVLPWFDNRKKELANRPLIREQAFGEALDVGKLESLGRFGKNGLCPVVAPKTRRFLTGGKSFVGRFAGKTANPANNSTKSKGLGG